MPVRWGLQGTVHRAWQSAASLKPIGERIQVLSTLRIVATVVVKVTIGYWPGP